MINRNLVILLALLALITACQTTQVMDAQTQELLAKYNAQPPIDLETASISDTRKWLEDQVKPSTISLASIQEVAITGEFPIRIYTPFGQGPFPVLVYLHGGGWVFGSLNTYDNLCRTLASKAGAIVVSVGYRLAPEHPFPVPLTDCFAAFQWTRNFIQNYNGNPQKIILAGDSAGGNLTAACTLLARQQGVLQPLAQVLIYPVTSTSTNSESYKQFAAHYRLSKSMMDYFIKAYITNPKDLHNPLASPLDAVDLSNLPPAYVVLATFDPLYSEGKEYAARLKNHVSVIVEEYPTLHGFLDYPELDITTQAVNNMAVFLKNTYGRQ